jgi:ParB-like chromosome segregation protein Spo0J
MSAREADLLSIKDSIPMADCADEVVLPDGRDYRVRFPDLIRPHTDEEFARLVESIRQNGQLQEVILDAEGYIIDGYHRLKACALLGINDVKFSGLNIGMNEENLLQIAADANVARRQMDDADVQSVEDETTTLRQRIVEARAAGRSLREIASEEGVSKSTVGRIVRSMDTDTAGVPGGTGERTTGRDGKSYPRARPAAR